LKGKAGELGKRRNGRKGEKDLQVAGKQFLEASGGRKWIII